MPLAERYDAGIATEEDVAELQKDVNEAAVAAGFPDVEYDPGIYDENGMGGTDNPYLPNKAFGSFFCEKGCHSSFCPSYLTGTISIQ